MKNDKVLLDQHIHILNTAYLKLSEVIEPGCVGKLELDLGCGKGSFTSALAEKYPERTVIAADVMIGRLRKLVKRNRRNGIVNMRVLRVEARHLVGYMLDDQSIDRIHVICPDPWPKHRHRHNRLISSQFMAQLSRVLKVGGIFHFATDDQPYFKAVGEICRRSGLFSGNNGVINDIREIKSDFELLWNGQGKEVFHSAWQKKSVCNSS